MIDKSLLLSHHGDSERSEVDRVAFYDSAKKLHVAVTIECKDVVK